MRTPELGTSSKSQNQAILAVLAAAAFFCLLMSSCGGSTVPLSLGIVVSVSPPTASVMVDGTQQFVVTVANTLNASVTWSVNDHGRWQQHAGHYLFDRSLHGAGRGAQLRSGHSDRYQPGR